MESIDRVYNAFYTEKNRWLYFSELIKKTGLSNSSLQNILNKLKKKGELETNKQTSNIFFKIIDTKKPFIFSKIDQKRLEDLNPEVRLPLKNWLKVFPKQIESVLLFGSASRKQEREGSDIDLVIILHKFSNEDLQKLYLKEIRQNIDKITKDINSESNYPLKPIFIDIDSFKTSKDHLINQAKETGFPIFGNLEYYTENEKN